MRTKKPPEPMQQILTELPPVAATLFNEAIGKYRYKGYRKPLPGGRDKPAMKMGIQAAVLLYFEGAAEPVQRQIIEAGLARYAEILGQAGSAALHKHGLPPVAQPASDAAPPKRKRRDR